MCIPILLPSPQPPGLIPKTSRGFCRYLIIPSRSLILSIQGKSNTSAPPQPYLSKLLDLFVVDQTLKKDVSACFYLRALIIPRQLWVLSVRPPPFSGKIGSLCLSPSGRLPHPLKSKIPVTSPCLTGPPICFAEVFLEATLWKPSMCSPSPHFLGVLTKKISPGTTTSVKLASAQALAGHQGGSFDLPVSPQLLSMGCASPFFHMNKEEILEACLSCIDGFRSLAYFCQDGVS